tara:strand:+ start:2748 stop:2855 length:108 start_codon:yes stop_codon:yes gene_type:complete
MEERGITATANSTAEVRGGRVLIFLQVTTSGLLEL